MKRLGILLIACLVTFPLHAQEFQTGVAAYGKGDYATAVRVFQVHAEQGDAAAQFNLGFMYRKGQGVGKDNSTAVEWWLKSAKQGFEQAQQSLVFMYTYGVGAPKNHAKAAYWKTELELAKAPPNREDGNSKPIDLGEVEAIRSAAEDGNAIAQVELATLYEVGEGVPQDFVKAHAWYNLAAAQGRRAAARKRDNIAKQMTPKDISQAQRLAAELAQMQSGNGG